MTDLLTTLGTTFGTRNANARTTAALLSNPGCHRRAVLDAARVDLSRVATQLGAPTEFGQSPFALGQGNRFEQRIKDDDHAALAKAIDDLLGIFGENTSLRSIDLGHLPGIPGPQQRDARAERTAEVLDSMARGATDAPHIVDHGMTRLDVAGDVVYLEQDALAFRQGKQLRICEIKGFPIIDGTAAPTKVGAAARQTAVYVASIQDTLASRGHDPTLVSSEVVLVCPRNFSLEPVAVLVDVDREVRALRRQLRRRAAIGDLLAEIAAVLPHPDALQHLAARASDQASTSALIDALPNRYAPECLSNCDLARYCRGCAEAADDPARLGGEVGALLGGIDTVARAIELADGAPEGPDHDEVAAILRSASAAIDDASRTTP